MQQKRIISPNINSHQDKEKVKTMGIIIYKGLVIPCFHGWQQLTISLCSRITSYQTMQRLQTSNG